MVSSLEHTHVVLQQRQSSHPPRVVWNKPPHTVVITRVCCSVGALSAAAGGLVQGGVRARHHHHHCRRWDGRCPSCMPSSTSPAWLTCTSVRGRANCEQKQAPCAREPSCLDGVGVAKAPARPHTAGHRGVPGTSLESTTTRVRSGRQSARMLRACSATVQCPSTHRHGHHGTPHARVSRPTVRILPHGTARTRRKMRPWQHATHQSHPPASGAHCIYDVPHLPSGTVPLYSSAPATCARTIAPHHSEPLRVLVVHLPMFVH